MATPLPFILDDREGEQGTLYGHVARANPQWRNAPIGEAMAIFMGPDAYVTPSWYATKQETGKVVPTWNYIAVHLRGVLEPLPGAALAPHVDALSAEHEGRIAGKTPWTSAKMTEGAMPRMMRMILPFRFHVTSVEGTWKLNQNKTPEIRARSAAALSQGDEASRRIAALISDLPQS